MYLQPMDDRAHAVLEHALVLDGPEAKYDARLTASSKHTVVSNPGKLTV